MHFSRRPECLRGGGDVFADNIDRCGILALDSHFLPDASSAKRRYRNCETGFFATESSVLGGSLRFL